MKITKIDLKNFHQFKDFNIDLTYPIGHKKEGQPLDKVCFIGQSGTGKTSLLELIPKFVRSYNTKLIIRSGGDSLVNAAIINLKFGFDNEYSTKIFFEKKEKISWIWTDRRHQEVKMDEDEFYKYFKEEWYNKIASKIIYFPANINFDIELILILILKIILRIHYQIKK